MIAIMSPDLDHALVGLPWTERRLDAKAGLFHRDDPVQWMHRIVTGEVRLLRRDAGGGELILQRAGAGEVVAEPSLWSGRYHCDAEAATPTVLRRVPVTAMRDLLVRDGDAARAWMMHLGAAAQAARLRAEILSLRRVAERLDAWLSMQGAPLPGPGAWRGLAAEIGVTPEALYREIARRRG